MYLSIHPVIYHSWVDHDLLRNFQEILNKYGFFSQSHFFASVFMSVKDWHHNVVFFRQIHEKAVMLVFVPFTLLAWAKPQSIEGSQLVNVTALQVFTNAMLMHLFMRRNAVTVEVLLIFTLLLSFKNMTCARLSNCVLPLFLFVIFLIAEDCKVLSLLVPYHAYIQEHLDVVLYLPSIWLCLFRSAAYSVPFFYIYFKLYLNFLL